MPASGATLRRICSRNPLNPAKSLVLHTCHNAAPATSVDPAVEPALLGDAYPRLLDGTACGARQSPHVKGLDPDHVEPPRQVSGRLLHPINAPISLPGLEIRNRSSGPFAAVRATLATREPLLQNCQPLRLSGGEIGCMQQFAGRQRGRHRHAAVNTDHTPIARPSDRVGDVRERNMPAPSTITGDPVRLRTLRHRPRQPKPHPSDLGDPNPTEVAVQPHNVTRFNRDLAEPFMHAGFTPCRSAVRAAEKIAHGLIEIQQRLLLNSLTSGSKPRVPGARFRQLRSLLHISGSLATRLPVPLLFHRQIPHVPRIPAVRQQSLFLLRGG